MDRNFESQYNCRLCEYVTRNVDDIRHHLRTQHGNFDYTTIVLSLSIYFNLTEIREEEPVQRQEEYHEEDWDTNWEHVNLDSNILEEIEHEDVVNQDLENVFSILACRNRQCVVCNRVFDYVAQLDWHLFNEHPEHFINFNLNQEGRGRPEQVPEIVLKTSAFEGLIKVFKVNLTDTMYKSAKDLFADINTQLIALLKKELEWRHGLTFFADLQVIYVRRVPNDMGEFAKVGPCYINTFRHGIFHASMIRTILLRCASKLENGIETLRLAGSDKDIYRIHSLEFTVATNRPFDLRTGNEPEQIFNSNVEDINIDNSTLATQQNTSYG